MSINMFYDRDGLHMKNVVVGVLAHVDAGKTTLSEAILYSTGEIRNLGRVDNRDTLLDHDVQERERGITVFSKQAVFEMEHLHVTWLDTPGHVDFSAEMERTLQVLDYAVLVISASDGIQGHTRTLWRLLKQYDIPVFIFINKMDQPGNQRDKIMELLQNEISEGCVDFTDLTAEVLEELAVLSSDENILERYLEDGVLSDEQISQMISCRKIFPCLFGAALRLEGIDALIDVMDRFMQSPVYPDTFGARIYKITRDETGNRLTHMKITGGTIRVKDTVMDEKVNQIRIYTGNRYDSVNEAEAGIICTVTGLTHSAAGQGIGFDSGRTMFLIEPVLTYNMSLPDTVNTRQIYPSIKLLEEELPELNVTWNEQTEEIGVKLMGQVQLEILSGIITERFGFTPSFDTGTITYMETIASPVIGVGHFEPLRHYAEVHLLMEPGETGSGIQITSNCSEDILDKNWQRLIQTHLRERSFIGVLTGSYLTDVKITLINGKAHQKHTEGGDFRQATYRAVRQGLMQADSVLLEPYYSFRLEIPAEMVGRAMTDIENMYGVMEPPDIVGERAIITGRGPVATMRDYQINLNSYTHGTGTISVTFSGYERCHNPQEVIDACGYDPEQDIANPASSVFCSHGAGFIVPWYEVSDYMHVFDDIENTSDEIRSVYGRPINQFDYTIDLDEIDAIFARTFAANRREDKHAGYKKKKTPLTEYRSVKSYRSDRAKLLMVDGYNVIFAWDELHALAQDNIDSAKDRLLHVLSNYQGMIDYEIILVFDGYKVKGNCGSTVMMDNIKVVHTKENETADQYIEKFVHENVEKFAITVATSDGMIQQIVRGADGRILSSRELKDVIEEAARMLRDEYDLN